MVDVWRVNGSNWPEVFGDDSCIALRLYDFDLKFSVCDFDVCMQCCASKSGRFWFVLDMTESF